MLFRSGEKNVGANGCREVLEKRVGGKVSERSIEKANYRDIYYKNMGKFWDLNILKKKIGKFGKKTFITMILFFIFFFF